VFEHNFATRHGDVTHSSGLNSEFRALYRSRFGVRNVWLNVPRVWDPGATFAGTELVPNWELVQTEFYRGWLRPQKVIHALISTMFRQAEEARFLVALRPLDGPPFDGRDKRLVEALLPRLQCACELSV